MIKYISFERKGIKSYGILNEEYVFDIRENFNDMPGTLIEYIKGPRLSNNVILNSKARLKNDVRIISPIEVPQRGIFCVGMNYREHLSEIKDLQMEKEPEYPVFFTKNMNRILGDGDYINVSDSPSTCPDYEAELALIIGRDCKNLTEENAESVIFGYSIANDFSARDLQKDYSQWMKGKSLDDFCAMGPYIVDAKDLQVENLEIKSFVNGELRQNSNTKNLIFNIKRILIDLSKGMTIKAGDIIFTGTPKGVGGGFNPPKYLKKNDKVTCFIENIGELTNFVK